VLNGGGGGGGGGLVCMEWEFREGNLEKWDLDLIADLEVIKVGALVSLWI